MRKVKTIAVYLVSLTFLFALSAAKAESFDPEVVSQVSKAIAEWKLMNIDNSETQVNPPVYVSSALSKFVERGEGVAIVKGLAAFGSDYRIESQIRQWELNTGVRISNKYISRFPNNPWRDVGGSITTTTIGSVYGATGTTFNAADNFLRSQQGLGSSSVALQNTAVGLSVYNTASTLTSGATTFMQTIDKIGTSMQIINPPIYLEEKTLGGWKGEGSYSIPAGRVCYHETLNISASKWWQSGTIVRKHTDWVSTNLGTYYRNVKIETHDVSPGERFMMRHYPVGGYFDPGKTTITTTTRIHQSYRIETRGGVTKITPLTTYYTPPIPKMPRYTPPRIPSSSFGRKY